ncbi:MAG: S8 family serine peptidase [Bacteroidota bacterium]
MAYKIVIPSESFMDELNKSLAASQAGYEAGSILPRTRSMHVEQMILNAPSRKSGGGTIPQQHFHSLHNLCSFVIDSDHLDEDYFRAVFDAQIHENVKVASVTPTELSAEHKTHLPEFWHKEKLKVGEQSWTGQGITVGVLDSGIYTAHQEFEGKTVKFAEFDKNGRLVGNTAKDFGTHGTHVCGLLAGKNAGIAPDAALTVAAVLTENGGEAGYLAQILGGLNWLLGDGTTEGPDAAIHLINASIETSPGFNDYLYAALKNATTTPGTLMVAAIGNDGSKGVNSDTSPGNYDLTIGVGALNEDDEVASFSSWGKVEELNNISKPDLSAPGVWLYSSLAGPGNLYFKQSGTSMASPVACGVAALLLEKEPDLRYQPEKLKELLIKAVVPVSDKERAGAGRVNIIE